MKKRHLIQNLLYAIAIMLLFICSAPVLFAKAADDVWYGDVDEDGDVTAKDVTMLRRYLAGGWNASIDTDKADVDQNGEVNSKDVTMLRRYIAGGWGVKLPVRMEEFQELWRFGYVSSPNYSGNWSSTVDSYLYEEDGYFFRVERCNDYDNDGQYKIFIIIENYDSSWNTLSSKKLAFDENLIWGGFYHGKEYNFIVLGQDNTEENDDKMVVRVIRYDKDWKESGHVDLCGAYTTVPFKVGSLRFAELDGYLYVHTCHQRYSTEDGKKHQSNMTFFLKEDTLEITGTGYYLQKGYVSHSFNQYIIADSENHIVLLDHGDAYGRAAELSILDTKNGVVEDINDSFGYTRYSVQKWADALDSSDMSYLNMTGAELGGIKETSKGYVIPFSYDEEGGQKSDYGRGTVKNLYVAFLSKREIEVQEKISGTIIEYDKSGTTTARCPVIVSTGLNDGGYIFWEDGSLKNYDNTIEFEENIVENVEKNERTVNYVKYDINGNISDISSFKGYLSDCEPLFYNGRIYWYETFYINNKVVPMVYIFDTSTEKITTQFVSDRKSNTIETYKVDKAKKEYYVCAGENYIVDNEYDSESGDRIIKKILRDRDYGYEFATITYNYDSKGNKIGGIFKSQDCEYIFQYSENVKDLIVYIEQKLYGTNSVKKYYDSGILKYEKKTTKQENTDVILNEREKEYDEKGRPVKYIRNDLDSNNTSRLIETLEYYENDILKKYTSVSNSYNLGVESETKRVEEYDIRGGHIFSHIVQYYNGELISDNEEWYEYDESGDLIKKEHRDMRGETSIYEYENSRIIKKELKYDDGETYNYEYNENGKTLLEKYYDGTAENTYGYVITNTYNEDGSSICEKVKSDNMKTIKVYDSDGFCVKESSYYSNGRIMKRLETEKNKESSQTKKVETNYRDDEENSVSSRSIYICDENGKNLSYEHEYYDNFGIYSKERRVFSDDSKYYNLTKTRYYSGGKIQSVIEYAAPYNTTFTKNILKKGITYFEDENSTISSTYDIINVEGQDMGIAKYFYDTGIIKYEVCDYNTQVDNFSFTEPYQGWWFSNETGYMSYYSEAGIITTKLFFNNHRATQKIIYNNGVAEEYYVYQDGQWIKTESFE